VPKDAQVVEVLAQQWHWSYRLPGKDGKLGTVHSRFVTDANPFGMNPGDPNGRDDVLLSTPEVHVPLGQPIKLLLRSKDVLHNFSVAQIRVKMDMVPGLVTYIWFTPTRTGSFDLLCEELCGIGHYAMRGRLVVDEPPAFQAWLDRQQTFAQAHARPAGDAVAGKAAYAACAACHGANGEGNVAVNAPRLSGQGAWYLERQLKLFKQGLRGTHEKDVYGKMMAPMAATLVDDAAIANVSAFLASLPDAPAATTIKGNREQRQAALRDLRRLPRRRRPRDRGHQRTQAAGHERLVHGHAAEELQGRHSRGPCAGHLRRPDGADLRDAGRRRGDRRHPGLYQLG
jgi:cytochrome c oxidase subunit 2